MGARRTVLCFVIAALSAACTDPHAPPQIDRLDCYGCHGTEFDAVPLHAAENASTECYRCHGTAGWYPVVPRDGDAPRRHTWFPIDRGDHAGYDCWQCHIDTDLADPYNEPTDEFSCIDCHAHTEGRTWPWHIGMDSFEYKPKGCYRCHRRGRGDD